MESKEFTIEELEKQYKEVTDKCNAIGERLKQKKKEEEDRRQAELALEKDKRRKEIEEAEKKLSELYTNYLNDYGTIAIEHTIGDHNFFTPFMKHFWL